MEELKEATYTESSVQTSTDSPASTDSPNTELNQSQEISYDEMQNISQVIPIDNETQKKSQVTLLDETQNNSQETLLDETEKILQEAPVETPSEPIEIKTEDANTTNCLALTIQADHRLVAFKNVLSRSIRMSWKVVVSTITLALIKLFS